eukprot:6456224-Amphidinium_carterae.1
MSHPATRTHDLRLMGHVTYSHSGKRSAAQLEARSTALHYRFGQSGMENQPLHNLGGMATVLPLSRVQAKQVER